MHDGVVRMTVAKPCEKCNSYYPGDCAQFGCKDVANCPCDGCDVVRHWIEQGEMDPDDLLEED